MRSTEVQHPGTVGGTDAQASSGMVRATFRMLSLTGIGVCVILFLLALSYPFKTPILRGLALIAIIALALALFYFPRTLERFLEADSLEQSVFLDAIDARHLDLAISVAAALSLFLELAMIRWQSSVLEFLAFYKNFSLLACFAGLGLGYALAARKRILLLLVIPLLGVQFGFIMFTRMVPEIFRIIPFREQLTMGMVRGSTPQASILFLLLSVIFLLTALTFLPIGQLCGRLMERRGGVRAYGLNLVGSLAGVLLMLAASFLWTPPAVWFAVCFLGLLLFQARRGSALTIGLVSTVLCAIILAWWPIDPLWTRVYSPYQLLEIGTEPNTGLTMIRAAGHYYQRIHDFAANSSAPEDGKVRDYYDFAYKAHPALKSVAVVGAGTGNDVAAALRAGAERVDAIEIDPAILLAGKERHPENPYQNSRTHAFNNDARSFLRGTTSTYDLIVYGLLDSHTLLSQGSSVRLDSFVYTLEGLREARSRLKPDGMISLSFAVLSDAMGRKIYLMLQQVFDGRPPVCVKTYYDGSVIFLESSDKNWRLPPALVTNSGFANVTEAYANPSLKADVSTDDWPFFYMPKRVYPVSYLIMIAQILILSLVFAGNFVTESPRSGHLAFFFLGIGFMLVETKGITELGLTFGNTWQVIGFVIAGILTMAFLGNCLVQWLKIRRTLIPYLLLMAALVGGWWMAGLGGFASTTSGRLETLALLTAPLLFSGIIFSTLLSSRGRIAAIMAMNLLGAMLGGLLEYNSMYFGFRALYVMAMVAYLLAFVSELIFRNNEVRKSSTETSY